MSNPCRIIITTCATPEQAHTIAHALINKRLIACATLLPQAQSVYRWEGKIAEESETVMLLKSTLERIPQLEKELLALHPYRVPEFIVLCPEQVGTLYSQWLTAEVAPTDSKSP